MTPQVSPDVVFMSRRAAAGVALLKERGRVVIEAVPSIVVERFCRPVEPAPKQGCSPQTRFAD